jgi:hypothetical protein
MTVGLMSAQARQKLLRFLGERDPNRGWTPRV